MARPAAPLPRMSETFARIGATVESMDKYERAQPFLVAAARCSSAAHEVASNPPPLLECVQPSFNKHLDRLHANLVRGLEDSAVRYNTTAAWILSEDE
jgi:hypothetical protein